MCYGPAVDVCGVLLCFWLEVVSAAVACPACRLVECSVDSGLSSSTDVLGACFSTCSSYVEGTMPQRGPLIAANFTQLLCVSSSFAAIVTPPEACFAGVTVLSLCCCCGGGGEEGCRVPSMPAYVFLAVPGLCSIADL